MTVNEKIAALRAAAKAAGADGVLLMTYEWGYTAGPPMAVSPLPNVRAVLDYAVTEIPPPMWQIIRFKSSYFAPLEAA